MAIYRITYEDGSATHHAEASQHLAQLYMALTGRLVEDASDLPDAEDRARGNLTIEQELGVWEGEQTLAAEAEAKAKGYSTVFSTFASHVIYPDFSALYGEARRQIATGEAPEVEILEREHAFTL